jgi:MFS transporter, OCT family, solute carrier family 22 (organic cation transporter), member 18
MDDGEDDDDDHRKTTSNSHTGVMASRQHHQHHQHPPPPPSAEQDDETTNDKNGVNDDDDIADADASSASNNRRILWVTYVNIVLYALCYQLQRPVEPFLVKELSARMSNESVVVTTYGQLQSFFSMIQTMGSPLVGILLDRVGIRKASAAVFLASAVSYGLLAHATTMRMLFLTKLPTLLQHAFLVAQAVAATSCPGNEAARAQALGRMTTAYTVGATLGPALGGFLAGHGDFYLGAKLAVVGSCLSVLLSWIFLPDNGRGGAVVASNDGTSSQQQHDHSSPSKNKPLQRQRSFCEEVQNSAEMARRSALWPLLVVKIISGVSSSMYHTALPMVLTAAPISLDPAQLGLTMSAGMLASAIFGAFGMALATEQLGGAMGMTKIGLLLRPGFGLVLAMLLARPYLRGLSSIIALSIAHSLTSHFIATGLTTQTTGAVSAHEQGALLGLEHGLFSMARIAAPTAGTALLTMSDFTSIALCCGAVDVALWGLLLHRAHQIACGQKPKER